MKDAGFETRSKACCPVHTAEIPASCWLSYDVVRYVEKLSANVTAKIRQGAYTSPIWYGPKG